jgi:hypothetical protein
MGRNLLGKTPKWYNGSLQEWVQLSKTAKDKAYGVANASMKLAKQKVRRAAMPKKEAKVSKPIWYAGTLEDWQKLSPIDKRRAWRATHVDVMKAQHQKYYKNNVKAISIKNKSYRDKQKVQKAANASTETVDANASTV